jgi:hypothetical protein
MLTNSIIYNIENIQQYIYVKYINNLIIATNKSNYDNQFLKEIINNDIENNTISVNENPVLDDNQTDVKIISENIDYLYLKPWSKLNPIHKIIKIKEFINNLSIKNDSEKEELISDLIEIIKDKYKKVKINYDETKGKIISISCLSYDNDKYFINNHNERL